MYSDLIKTQKTVAQHTNSRVPHYIYSSPELMAVSVWAFCEAEPETRTRVWVFYLGGDPLNLGWRNREWSRERGEADIRVYHWRCQIKPWGLDSPRTLEKHTGWLSAAPIWRIGFCHPYLRISWELNCPEILELCLHIAGVEFRKGHEV